MAAILAGAILGCAGVAWLMWPAPPPPSASLPAPVTIPPAPLAGTTVSAPAVLPPPPPTPPVEAPPPPAIPIRLADEATIRANRTTVLEVFRFAPNPDVLVLDFPDLAAQGSMLNRVAALIEKAGLPRDRVLADADLAAAIRAHGVTPDVYYLGHDYRMADLVRFFALADRDGIALNESEEWLRRLVRQELAGADAKADATADARADARADRGRAVLAIPQVSQVADESTRAVMLHHELSHGEYFTRPHYAAYAERFFRTVMTPREQDGFRRWLAGEGYDPAQDDLIVNETQAYLMHTPDPRFFSARLLGLGSDQLARLQVLFLTGMPAGWLRDCTTAPNQPADQPPATAQPGIQPGAQAGTRPAAVVAPAGPARRTPARRQRTSLVRRIRAVPDRRTPRRCAASTAACRSRT